MTANPGKKAVGCKQRVLETACRYFSEFGYRGTHIREVCQCAQVNLATVGYHFHGKEKLYAAVSEEACRQLLMPPESLVQLASGVAPEEKLRLIIECLFQKLAGQAQWVAKLAARELLEPFESTQFALGAELRDYYALLIRTMEEALGPDADPDVIRLHAISALSQCVFYCAALPSLARTFSKLEVGTLTPENLARHVVGMTRASLRQTIAFPPASTPAQVR